jgi:serine/threonine-protein kinase
MANPDQERVETLFLAAMCLASAERDTFLSGECGQDAALRGRVDALLAAADSSESFFAGFSSRLGSASLFSDKSQAREVDGASAGDRVGPYTLSELIASGGMGSVWRATRADGRFEGQVAIKFVHLQGGEAALRRFELEGGFLARLTHPHIARLLDAGVTEAGRPYLVLEFVDGVPIDQFAERQRLGIAARLGLFLDVLAAVQHAHAHLLVHRDLKPSNVLVTAAGEVKLLDFGVAKLLAGEEHAGEPGVTRDIGLALTPEYAAPEQFLGQPITTATDVYALGLLLYRLLSGRHAREDVGAGSQALMKLATAPDPGKPSDAVTDLSTRAPDEATRIAASFGATPPTLRKTLRGDLDNIVTRATTREATRRYPTVADLAADLCRYLAHEPVTAQAPTVRYRVSKFVRRHRGGVAMALTFVLALICTSAIALWQMAEARTQRDASIYQQRRTLAANEFMSLVFQELPREEALTPRLLLERTTRLLDQQYAQDDPLIGQVLLEVSRRYSQLGDLASEARLLERAENIGRARGDADTLATALCRRAYSQFVAEPAAIRARVDEARRALASLREPALDSIESCARAEALMLEAEGRRAHGIAVLMAARTRILAAPATTATLQTLLANEAAFYHAKDGNLGAAIALTEDILRTLEAAGRGNTHGYLQVLGNLATYHGAVGEYVGEAATWTAIRTRAARVDRPAETLATFDNRHALVLGVLAKHEEALDLLRSSRNYFAGVGNLRELAITDLYTAQVLILAGRGHDATQALDAAERHFSRNPAAFERELTSVALARAEIRAQVGDAQSALADIEAHLAKIGYPARKTQVSLIAALRRASQVALLAGNPQAAERYASDGLAAAGLRSRSPESNGNAGMFLLLRAQARQMLARPAQARDDAHASILPLTNGLGADHPLTSKARQFEALLQES